MIDGEYTSQFAPASERQRLTMSETAKSSTRHAKGWTAHDQTRNSEAYYRLSVEEHRRLKWKRKVLREMTESTKLIPNMTGTAAAQKTGFLKSLLLQEMYSHLM